MNELRGIAGEAARLACFIGKEVFCQKLKLENLCYTAGSCVFGVSCFMRMSFYFCGAGLRMAEVFRSGARMIRQPLFPLLCSLYHFVNSALGKWEPQFVPKQKHDRLLA